MVIDNDCNQFWFFLFYLILYITTSSEPATQEKKENFWRSDRNYTIVYIWQIFVVYVFLTRIGQYLN